MLFSSISFLYYFFPIVVFLYFIVPKPIKNVVLLLASLTFYAWGEQELVLLFAFSILLGYILGLLIEKFRGKWQSKLFLILSLLITLGFLGYYKYTDFFIENINSVFRTEIPLLKIALPIGISFYTFQILSYTVDVYRGTTKAQKDPIAFAVYVSMFPQLIAGPIVRYTDIESQLKERKIDINNIALGLRRFILGLGKKILIANVLGEVCDIYRASNEQSVVFLWLYAISYTLHIYFDFSGYSDMAIGLGKIFGFEFMENFNYPYISGSITEFWRRWHISLGSWFRDYVYIPLGGNRCSKLKHLFNLFVVWMLTGLWHGAAWNFVIWGLLYAVLLVSEKYGLLKLLEKIKGLRHVYVMLFVMIGFIIFNAADMKQAWGDIIGLFGATGLPLISDETLYYLRSYSLPIVLGIIGSTPLPKMIVAKVFKSENGEKVRNILEPIVLAILLIVMTGYLVDGSFNPFLYFRF